MKETFSLDNIKGYLNLKVFRKDECIQEENHNLVVNNAAVVFSRLLALGSTNSNTHIKRIAFGTGNYPSAKTKSTLDGDVYIKNITSFTHNSPNEAEYFFRLELHEFNNKNIWQFGLLSGEDSLFSMFSRNPTYVNPIAKDDEVYIIGTWKIEIVNS